MASIDTRVVEMQFKSGAFENGVRATMSGLTALKNALRLDGATKGLDDINAAGKRVNLSAVGESATSVASKFSAMSVIAVTALATIAHKALTVGGEITKSLTIKPVMDGLREYETNLNSIQTIMANTGLEGSEGLGKVNTALDELNHYSDQTIYNFSEMAKNIGTFTAAGVDLDTSTNAIKGIANLAALSGSNSQQASTAMYQLSQAMAAGKVSLMDWNSVVNAGMGGKVFQEALKDTARVQGIAVDDIIEKNGSFRDSLQDGWLTTEVLTSTLSQFTGDMTADQLKSMGYTQQQIEGILKMGQVATDAATKVKTMSQLMGTLQEAATSGWAKSWQLIFGDFDQAKELFTNVNSVLGGMIGASADARNKVLGDWNALGGRTVLIEGIANAFRAVMAVLAPIKDAFRDIFPAKTGQDLFNLTVKFRDFTAGLMAGGQTIENLRRTFAGVFAVFSILGQILGAAIGQVLRFFGAVSSGSGGFLEITASVGDFLVALDQMLRQSGIIQGFFQGLGSIIAIPLRIIGMVADALGSIFSGFDSGGANRVNGALDSVSGKMEGLRAVGERIKAFFRGLGDTFAGIGARIGEALGGVGQAVANAFTAQNFSLALSAINTGLFAMIALAIRSFFSNGIDIGTGGLFDSIKDSLDSVTGALTTMQSNVKADILIKIGVALALLTASIVALSTVDSEKLAVSMAALAVGFGGLNGALILLATSVGIMGTLKLPLLTASLLLLAIALLGVAAAMKILSTIEGEDIGRALIAIAGSLGIIAAAMRLMPKGMLVTAASISVLAGSLVVLAIALKLFASMTWEEMARGLIGLAGSLLVLAGAMRLMPKGMMAQAAAITVLAGAIFALGIALKVFSTFSLEETALGLVALGGSLLVIAGAMRLMPQNMLVQAAGLLAVAVALNIMAVAMKQFGGMSWDEIGRGLVVLGGSLLILAGGLYLMSGTLAGAAALLVAAGALAVLVPVMIALGNLSWQTIITSLVALAAVFVVLGLAGYVLAPLTPILIGLSVAMVLIGAGLALAGVGALAFAAAFATMVAIGAAGVQVLAGILQTFIAQIPAALEAFGQGIVRFAQVIAANGRAFFDAFRTILTSIIDAIRAALPKIGQLFNELIALGLNILVTNVPRFARAGLTIIIELLKAIRSAVPQIVPLAIDIVTRFINAIAGRLGSIIQAGVNLVISFVNGVANAIRNNSSALGAAGANLGTAIIEGMGRALSSGIRTLASKAAEVARSALNAAKSVLGINSPSKEFKKVGEWSVKGLAKGLDDTSGVVSKAGKKVGTRALEVVRKSMSGLGSGVTEVDIQPVITPVLDLTKVNEGIKKLNALRLTKQVQMNLENSRSGANQVSALARDNKARNVHEANEYQSRKETQNSFVQNNYSPKALSASEIYRQTRNQLSAAKGALIT